MSTESLDVFTCRQGFCCIPQRTALLLFSSSKYRYMLLLHQSARVHTFFVAHVGQVLHVSVRRPCTKVLEPCTSE
jgi:hypothetical protein